MSPFIENPERGMELCAFFQIMGKIVFYPCNIFRMNYIPKRFSDDLLYKKTIFIDLR